MYRLYIICMLILNLLYISELQSTIENMKSMVIGTWAECARRKIEHYYEVCRGKYEVASNRNGPCSGCSENWFEREEQKMTWSKTEQVSRRKFLTCILSKYNWLSKRLSILLVVHFCRRPRFWRVPLFSSATHDFTRLHRFRQRPTTITIFVDNLQPRRSSLTHDHFCFGYHNCFCFDPLYFKFSFSLTSWSLLNLKFHSRLLLL